MTDNATKTSGSALKVGDGGAPETFAAIAEVRSIDHPKSPGARIDATTLESTEREYLPGLLDRPVINATLLFKGNDTNLQQLESDSKDGTVRNYEIVLADTSKLAFAASVTGFGFGVPGPDDVISVDVDFERSGAGTWTWAT